MNQLQTVQLDDPDVDHPNGWSMRGLSRWTKQCLGGLSICGLSRDPIVDCQGIQMWTVQADNQVVDSPGG